MYICLGAHLINITCSAKTNAICIYVLVTITTIIIEYSFGVSLNIYHYVDMAIEAFLNVITPMQPTTGNWADSTNYVRSIVNVVRLFLRVLSYPISFITVIIYLIYDK